MPSFKIDDEIPGKFVQRSTSYVITRVMFLSIGIYRTIIGVVLSNLPQKKPSVNHHRNLCMDNKSQGGWLSDHPCSVKYQTVRTLFIWSLNWLTDTFSVSLEMNCKLLTGLKLGKTSSRPSFLRRDFTRAFFHSSWKYPIWRDLFTKSVITGSRESRQCFKSHVGIGWLLHCLFGDCLISFLTSSSVVGWKERNISSSFPGTLGIVIGSRSWLSHFVPIFWIFIIKKSPNASARSFQESISEYCSCCNGF